MPLSLISHHEERDNQEHFHIQTLVQVEEESAVNLRLCPQTMVDLDR